MAVGDDKIGDPFVEIHARLDEKSVKKVDAQLDRALLDRTKKEMQAAVKLDQQRQKALAARATEQHRAHAAELRAVAALEAQKRKHFEGTLDRQKAALRDLKRTMSEQAKAHGTERKLIDQDVIKARIALEREFGEESKKIYKEVSSEFDKFSRRRRGKDGGMLNLGESLENITSILPGQLEKLLRNPAIATTLSAALLPTFSAAMVMTGAALAGTVGAGALIGGIVAIVKKDREVALAFELMGDAVTSAWIQKSVVLKNETIALFTSIRNAASTAISTLNFAPLERGLQMVADEIGPFIKQLGEAFNTLAPMAGAVIGIVAKNLPALGRAFQAVSDAINDHKREIVMGAQIIMSIIEGAIHFVAGLIRVGAATFDFLLDRVRDVLAGLKHLAQAFAMLPGAGDTFKALEIQLGGMERALDANDQAVDGFAAAFTNAKTIMGETLAPISDVEKATIKLRDATADAAEAWKDALSAQRDFDSSLKTSLDPKIAYHKALDDISEALKDNGRNWDITTEAGRDNFETVKRGLQNNKDAILSEYEAGRKTRAQALAEWTRVRDGILKQASATGEARTALNKFGQEIGAFPKDVRIEVTLNAQRARDALADLEGYINSVRSKGQNITIGSSTRVARAGGGPISGPGTSTSDSIPANLSDGEFVIKASSAKAIGMSNLAQMNATGKIPRGFAAGTASTKGRGKTLAEANLAVRIQQILGNLNRTVAANTAQMERFTKVQEMATEQFKSFVGPAGAAQGAKSAGDVIKQMQKRAAQSDQFLATLQGLKSAGLGQGALSQIAEAGPDSDIAALFAGGIGQVDAALINQLMGKEAGYASALAGIIEGPKASNVQAQKDIAAYTKRLGQVKPPRASGATVTSAPGGGKYAVLSKQEMAQQQLKAGTYVTVLIDGKEVRAIVKQETAKSTKKATRNIKSGKR